MNLFVIYIGGKTKNSLIEVHDLRIIIAEKIEDTYAQLKAEWWGSAESLHLDCYGILRYADGYNINIVNEKPIQNEKLFFLNLGGYNNQQFTELHKNIFIVAENEQQAKIAGLKQIKTWNSYHRDNLFEVENCLNLNHYLAAQNIYLKLEKTDQEQNFEFICKYILLK